MRRQIAPQMDAASRVQGSTITTSKAVCDESQPARRLSPLHPLKQAGAHDDAKQSPSKRYQPRRSGNLSTGQLAGNVIARNPRRYEVPDTMPGRQITREHN